MRLLSVCWTSVWQRHSDCILGALTRMAKSCPRIQLTHRTPLMRQVCIVIALVTVSSCTAAPSEPEVTELSLCTDAIEISGAAFTDHAAAFVWYDPVAETAACYGAVSERRRPASTFKIPHALIALDSGVIDVQASRLQWDSEKYPRESWWPDIWSREHTLVSALEHSVVWYYREVAEMVGAERERQYLELLDLGNAEVGDNPTSFWLVGPLAISAEEQVVFLNRLWQGSLPTSLEAQRLTREMVSVLAEVNGMQVRGKTGTDRMERGALNWLVGAVERPQGPAFFALWIEAIGWLPTDSRVRLLTNAMHALDQSMD